MSPLSVMYPNGNLSFQGGFAKVGDKIGDVYGSVAIEVIARHLSSARKRPVRVLEVGAGLGAMTHMLVPKLQDVEALEYYFTDLGNAFVKNAAKTFAAFSFMRYQVFDITKPPEEQGLEAQSFDAVIAYNVVHTTKSVRTSLGNLRRALCPEGALFVMESAKNEAWSNLAWGLLDGWWYFEDYDLRPDEPMLSLSTWERVFQEVGFSGVYAYPTDARRRRQTEKGLIVGTLTPCVSVAASRPQATADAAVVPVSPNARPRAGKPPAVASSTVPQETTLELVTAIWEEVLEYEQIGPDEDFFARGGDSLLAVKMLELFNEKCGVKVEIADIFAYPTISKMTRYLETLGPSSSPKAEGPVIPIRLNEPCAVSTQTEASLLSARATDQDLIAAIERVDDDTLSIADAVDAITRRAK